MHKRLTSISFLFCITFLMFLPSYLVATSNDLSILQSDNIKISSFIKEINEYGDEIIADPLERNPTILNEMGLNNLINQGYNGTNITIGILDTGVDYRDLRLDNDGNGATTDDRKVTNYVSFVSGEPSYDLNSHGTMIAGLLASNYVNGWAEGEFYEFQGFADGVNLWSVKVLNASGSGDENTIIAGLDYCIEHADEIDIINLSFGVIKDALNQDILEMIEAKAIECWNAGIVVVCAAGNEGSILNSDVAPFYTINAPGSALEVLSVGAMAYDQYIADFSSLGPSPIDLYSKPEVVADGYNLTSIALNGGVAIGISGTSFSSPIIAGGIAIVLDKLDYKPSPNLIKAALIDSCSSIGYTIYEEGAGVPNFTRMAEILEDPNYRGITVHPKSMTFPNFFDPEKESMPSSTHSAYPEMYYRYTKATIIVGKDLNEGLSVQLSENLTHLFTFPEIPTGTEEGQYILGIDFVETMMLRSAFNIFPPGTYEGEIQIMDGDDIVAKISVTANVSFWGWLKVWWGIILSILVPILALVIVVKRKSIKNQFASECPKGWRCECTPDGNNCYPVEKLKNNIKKIV